MRSVHSFSSLMLMLLFVVLCLVTFAATYPTGLTHSHHRLAGRDEPTPSTKYPIPANVKVGSAHVGPDINTESGAPTSCDPSNGTTFIDNVRHWAKYAVICDIDFPDQNFYPFLLSASFDECLEHCEAINEDPETEFPCAGFVFAPGRINGADDCYLKSSLNNPVSASIHLVGATVVPVPSFVAPGSTSSSSVPTPRSDTSGSYTEVNVENLKLLGSSTNKPTNQYVSHVPATPQKLASDVLVPGLNTNFITKYPIASDTGSWTESELPDAVELSNMTSEPHMSRDGGKGGTINGTHIFVFCDTAIFNDEQGMIGFVSSSVVTDDGMKALDGEPLVLVDNLGEWQDDVGRMRAFAPMTTGEESFNIELSGEGYRYAVWPESSLIPLNASHALLYPALVYDVVDMTTQAAAFNDIGNSVLLVSVDAAYGPHADRVVPQLYQQDQVAFGTLGGIRIWGPNGTGGNDGHIYLFGRGDNGVLVARTSPGGFTDLSIYEYWDGDCWTSNMTSSSSNATMLDMQVQDLDVIYVPAIRSFLMIYLNTLADNTFYYRYLPLNLNADDKDFDGNYLVKAEWSDEKVLAKIDAPVEGYIYAGGLHAGYFSGDDITNGGWKMLITWTEHTGKDAATPESGYAHKSAVVELNIS
ncbi:hypothetical protein H2200_006949 [Cladophialophora chaetospira]|uniref:Apple domain-containing protein n=1 Tax=Cladophialophora chaetospira TaxID=386627 RepID=A0AA39CHN8_9EURO|nr:hypothetical protein H2200_006949 [Cladophialophora chaetospira]